MSWKAASDVGHPRQVGMHYAALCTGEGLWQHCNAAVQYVVLATTPTRASVHPNACCCCAAPSTCCAALRWCGGPAPAHTYTPPAHLPLRHPGSRGSFLHPGDSLHATVPPQQGVLLRLTIRVGRRGHGCRGCCKTGLAATGLSRGALGGVLPGARPRLPRVNTLSRLPAATSLVTSPSQVLLGQSQDCYCGLWFGD